MCTYNMVFIFALFLFSNAVDVGEGNMYCGADRCSLQAGCDDAISNLEEDKDLEDLLGCPSGYHESGYCTDDDNAWGFSDQYIRICHVLRSYNEITPDCECMDSWTDALVGGDCQTEQIGCTNCDDDSMGSWCHVDGLDNCKQEYVDWDGVGAGWFYCDDAPDCECKDSWTDGKAGGDCLTEQIGCTNCDDDSMGSWCHVDGHCKQEELTDGWFYCDDGCPDECTTDWISDGWCDDGDDTTISCVNCPHFYDEHDTFDGTDCLPKTTQPGEEKETNTENKALVLKNAQSMRQIEQAIGRSDANKAQQLRKANKAQQLREANQALRTALKALTARD